MLFMVVERFKNGEAAPVYRRVRERGRLAPEGLNYINSWVDSKFERCFQLMECEDPQLLSQWTAQWEDLVEFEIFEVVTSKEAAETISPLL